jgi:hypothetical protein
VSDITDLNEFRAKKERQARAEIYNKLLANTRVASTQVLRRFPPRTNDAYLMVLLEGLELLAQDTPSQARKSLFVKYIRLIVDYCNGKRSAEDLRHDLEQLASGAILQP